MFRDLFQCDLQSVHEGGTNKLLAEYSWDALSRAQQITYGDGTSDVYSQYDNDDNLKTLTENYGGVDNSVTFGYTWYENHQRNTSSVSDMLFQYVPAASTENYGPADVDNGLTSETGSLGNASMTYDGNHNLTYDGVNTLTYDVENRVVQAENSLACPIDSPCAYAYDPLGERKEKTVNGTLATAFVLAAGSEIADYYASSATWRLTVRGAGGLPLAEIVPGATEQIVYVHHDVQGSTVALTTAGGSGPADTYTYSDYGQPQSGSWSMYQYGGYRYDSETGLYYVNARYYSPVLGRFLQSDPAGFRGGMNLYAYTGNDPINFVDPLGLTKDGSAGSLFSGLGNTLSNSWNGLYNWFTSTSFTQAMNAPDPNAGDYYMYNAMMQQGGGSFIAADTVVTDATVGYTGAITVGIGGPAAVDYTMTYIAQSIGASMATANGTNGIVVGEYLGDSAFSYQSVAATNGMNAFDVTGVANWDLLNGLGYGQAANDAFINAAIESGQTIYTSSVPWATGGYGYASEIGILSNAGVETVPIYVGIP